MVLTISMSTPARSALRAASGIVRRIAVRDHLGDGGVVAHHQAVEFPFVPKDLVKQQRVARGWNAVQRIEGGHEAGHTSVAGGEEGPQINVAQKNLGNPGAVVFAAGFGCAIPSVMFGRGGERIGRSERIALKAAHHGGPKGAGEIRVFTRLSAMRPQRGSRVMSIIGAKVQRIPSAVASWAAMRAACSTRRDPNGGLAERNGKNSTIAVDDVPSEQERNFQAAFRASRCAALRRARPDRLR